MCRAKRRKDIFAVSGDRAQLQKKLERLPREGHEMLDPCLHAFGRNSPLRGLQIKLLPARLAKLPRPHKEEEGERQSDADDLAASVSVDRTQQVSQSRGIGTKTNSARRKYAL